ncbi:MAG: hypothetical protein K0S51_1776 [Bacillales bacterium]|jgi:hypothetical protein|nr:hypothetical protein [Bacillales bacterium]
MNEIEIIIDTEDIKEFLYLNLIDRGFIPEENFLEEISDIFFDYLITKNVIDELNEI